ncbi:synaptotagmin-13-like [Scleropages formosus]|uniref:Synaptotagmin-13-like n=1 Tax=Scleropages formosus TaxID=113540 RepID=A0A0N8JZ36_SCLFO|nr:synaptotagmin-13-like [Scleropages formosus]KPP68241.1 synaptotagmin-13-like [Scleropages formosus]
MIFSSAVVLGATLGTASGALTLCLLSLLCKQYRKGQLEGSQDADPEKTMPSVMHSTEQFSVEKSTEPIQPETQLKFPKTYKPKPSVTSPEVIGLPSYALATTDEPLLDKPATAELEHGILATAESEKVFIIPRQGSTKNGPTGAELKKSPTTSDSVLRPKLHFSLTYQSREKELHVTVMEVEHVNTETGCEGYVAGQLSTPSGRRDAQTTMQRLAPSMRWRERLVFPLPGGCRGEGEVALSLHSWDRFSRHVNLGTMHFKLADVDMMSDAECWVDLQPPKQEVAVSAGEILLSISYLPAANRLGVVVMKARGLQSSKLKDSIDLSVKLALKHQATKLKKKQTRRVKHKMNPVWNEMMMLEVPRDLLAKTSLELEVLNQAGVGRLEPLGRCQLGLQATGTGLQHWQQMLENPRKQIAMWHLLYA